MHMLTGVMSMLHRTRQPRVHDLKTKGFVLKEFNTLRTAPAECIRTKAWEEKQEWIISIQSCQAFLK